MGGELESAIVKCFLFVTGVLIPLLWTGQWVFCAAGNRPDLNKNASVSVEHLRQKGKVNYL